MWVKQTGLQKMMANQLLPWTLAGFFAGFSISHVFSTPVTAQLPATPAGIAPRSDSSVRVFKSDAGLMLKFVRPDRVSDFEATLARLKEALDRTHDPRRRQQAAGWKVFRAAETSLNGDIIYVFEINPVIPDADYAVGTILVEAFPSEAEFLFRRYADAYAAQQNVVNLRLIAALGESPK
jgi:hypothetical protein